MIINELVQPKSIAVIGASSDERKPGGKLLKNLLSGSFKGEIYPVNRKEAEVQGLTAYADVKDLPSGINLAILAIPAKFAVEAVRVLIQEKGVRAFIVVSAGFSEVGGEGKELERELVDLINKVKGNLIGPNCIGVMNNSYQGVFTEPIPQFTPEGCDFISGSGATACFIMEYGIPQGLTFSSVWSVGNSAQIGVEDVLKWMDENFDPQKSSRLKLLYLEQIEKPEMLLKHARSLREKGCRIAAIKAGSSSAGQRAASSHTGALASSDTAVEALFRKAGIVRCYSREELVNVAGVMNYRPLKGKKIAIITHAGGPGVMLTDALSKAGMEVPSLSGKVWEDLKERLFPGSSIANPIDFLATGTKEQLADIIDTVEESGELDGMAVIFGTPGLFDVTDTYQVLSDKIKKSTLPIYPVLPSIVTAEKAVDFFKDLGHFYFPDEVALGNALSRVYMTEALFEEISEAEKQELQLEIPAGIKNQKGYLSSKDLRTLFETANFPLIPEKITDKEREALSFFKEVGAPIVMKVDGILHKTDVGGVKLNLQTEADVKKAFADLMSIEGATGVILQKQVSGKEIFVGVKREGKFGHLILFGMGGIWIEVLKDTREVLVPANKKEVKKLLKELKMYPVLKGVRGDKGVNLEKFAD
jgi:acyl-CoA synthetase (NDP forming)